MLVTPEKIASVLALSSIPHSFAELYDLVTKVLPKHALKASVDRVSLGGDDRKKLLYRIIPEATYKRRKINLSSDESKPAERLARIFATTEFIWNSEEDARQFLSAPHPMLQGRIPLSPP